MVKKAEDKGFRYSKGDDMLFLDGVDVNAVSVSELLSGWKDLSRTKVLRSNIFVAGASLLEELASRVALGQRLAESLTSDKSNLENESRGQEKVVGLLRDHCAKAAMRQVAQDAKIKSLEKDKQCLRELIDYQKAELNE